MIGVEHFRQMRGPSRPSRLDNQPRLHYCCCCGCRLTLESVGRGRHGHGAVLRSPGAVRAAPLYLLLRAERESLHVHYSHLESTMRVLCTNM